MSKEELGIELHASAAKKNKEAEVAYRGIKKLGDIVNDISKEGFTNPSNKGWFAKSGARGSPSTMDLTPKLQNSTVIAKYSENKSLGLWRAHGNYLARENGQNENEKGLGFSEESNEIEIAQCLDSWQKAGDPRLWKIIISPEFGDKLDLKEHTRLFVKQLELDLETSLNWVAIDHYNTDNPHVHLLIRGIDQLGKNLDITPAYLKQGMRLRSQEIATKQIGYRTEAHAILARERQITSDRFTSLDNAILNRSTEMGGHKIFSLETRVPESESAREYRIHLIKRLKKLEESGIVKKLVDNSWQLPLNFKEQLKESGRLSAGLKILERHKSKMTDPNQSLVYSTLKNVGEKIIGRILGAGLDPDTDKPYLLIEAVDGKAHYITQTNQIHASRLQSDLVDGNIAIIEVKAFEPKGENTDTVKYVNVKDFGPHKQIPDKLIDEHLFDSLKKGYDPYFNLKETKGFAGKFIEALNKRVEFFKNHEVVLEVDGTKRLHTMWQQNLDNLSTSELTKDKLVKDWNQELRLQESTIVGKILYSSASQLLLEDIRGAIYRVDKIELKAKHFEVGNELCIESNINIGQSVSRTDKNLISNIIRHGYFSAERYKEDLYIERSNAIERIGKFFLKSEEDIDQFVLAHSRRADTWVRLELFNKNELKQYCISDQTEKSIEERMKEKLELLGELKTKEINYFKIDEDFIAKESNSQEFTKLDKILISIKDDYPITQDALTSSISADILSKRKEPWDLRGIDINQKNGELDAKNWLNKCSTLQLIEKSYNKPIVILDNTPSAEHTSYIGTILSIATEDKAQNKYLILDVGRELIGIMINQDLELKGLKVGQKVGLGLETSINSPTVKKLQITHIKQEQNKNIDLGK